VETRSLRLQREGRAVSFHVEPGGSVFGPGGVLYFHGEGGASSTAFSSEVVYELVRSEEGEAMGVVWARPFGPAVLTGSMTRVSFETNRIYQPGLLEAEDIWLWEGLGSGVVKTKSFTLSGVDGASPEPAQVVMDLQGGSDADNVVDHHVRVSVNGVVLGEEVFDGKRPHRMSVVVPGGLLREGSNDLVVMNVGDTGVSSLVFLDRFEVSYAQVSAVRGGEFEGSWSETGTVEVGGLSGAALVVDVTGAAPADGGTADITGGSTVKWLTGFETSGESVRFEAMAGHRYAVVSGEGVLRPRVEKPIVSTLRDTTNQADYVVIAPAAFLGAVEPLVERRQNEGLVTKAVSLEEIASVFGGGEASGEAMKEFVSYAFHNWSAPSLRYVLLVGDSSYDPRNFVGNSLASPLPVLWAKTSYLWTASDPSLGAVNGEDGLPDVAVGRLPARDVTEAQGLVRKVLDWEDTGQSLGGGAALVADDPDAAGDFEWDIQDIATSYLAGREVETIRLRELGGATRGEILGAMNSGLSLLSYVGHGGSAVWASENVLNSWDPPSLLVQSGQPLMLTPTCLNGYFVAPSYDSLAEAFLKVEGRGTIAAFSPSGLSLDGPAHQYHRAVMEEITRGSHARLGDAILAAQKAYAESGAFPELLSVYHLFGDPALKIR
jgi:hypothetical protein